MITQIARKNSKALAGVYALGAAGHGAEMLYPLATGIAINGVLSGNYWAIGWLVACHTAQLILYFISKRYDTRVFTRIYADFAGDVVDNGHKTGVDPSTIAARASLSREFIDFFELDLNAALYAAIAITVSLSALFWYDPIIGAFCLLLIIPLSFVAAWLGKRSMALNKGLNDRLEAEVEIIRGGHDLAVKRHFRALSGWRIKLSDAEASAFGLMESIVILLFAAALWRVGQMDGVKAGDVYAIFSYVWRFVWSLDQVPIIVQKLAKLKDLDGRFDLPKGE
jgi:ABC-type multidrug transport system fused ATPase/permease subunit